MIKEQVKKAIDEIRPQIQAHGGDVEFVDIQEGIVKVNLKGA
ncbi:NifU family protein, partial [[Eubacterium] cellulosolvens]